jgi:hypothetical protein
MAFITIKPTAADRRITNAIVAHTTPALEGAGQAVTWGADEKLLLALAVGGWLYAAQRPALRSIADHVLGVSLLSAVLPHLLKMGIDQTRPDRLTVKGHDKPKTGRDTGDRQRSEILRLQYEKSSACWARVIDQFCPHSVPSAISNATPDPDADNPD